MGTTNIVYVYGASGHGRVVADIARLCGYDVAGFIDDDATKDAITFKTFLREHRYAHVALGIGSNTAREIVYNEIKTAGANVLTLIHPAAVISQSVHFGEGSVVMAGAVINPDSVLGKGVIINTAAVIEHDNKIGDFAHVSPATALAGNVTVGDFAHVGIGASVIQGISIGTASVVGAGSTVIRDVPDQTTVVGTPAKECTR